MRCFASGRSVRSSAFRMVLVSVVALTLTAAIGGCKAKNEAVTEKTDKNVVAEQVQATMTVEATGTTESTQPATPTSSTVAPSKTATPTAPGKTATKPSSVAKIPGLPAKVATFAKNFRGAVWYPKALPAGYKIDMIDVVEMDPGSGLVCDAAFINGGNAIIFTQGSPKKRTYPIVSVGKVAWGTRTADVVHQDPTDTSTPKMIVLNDGGSLLELSGTGDFAILKSLAASMMPVK